MVPICFDMPQYCLTSKQPEASVGEWEARRTTSRTEARSVYGCSLRLHAPLVTMLED